MTFVKGEPRPPNAGRRAGTPNKATVRERELRRVASEDDRTIVNDVIQRAKAGDVEARRLYFRYLRPPLHESFILPVEYRAPRSPEEARALVLELGERLTRGEISVQAHSVLVEGLKVYLTDKAAEQGRRLDELEGALRGEEPDVEFHSPH
jgi:hypothetical protein